MEVRVLVVYTIEGYPITVYKFYYKTLTYGLIHIASFQIYFANPDQRLVLSRPDLSSILPCTLALAEKPYYS
jgi:hypothetical protein